MKETGPQDNPPPGVQRARRGPRIRRTRMPAMVQLRQARPGLPLPRPRHGVAATSWLS